MSATETAFLRRDVQGILIPQGEPITLPKDSQVMITQQLGGSYTVICNGVMARIEGKDADALGKETPVPVSHLPAPVSAKGAAPDASTLEKAIWEQLKSCFDPEIPVNIVDLGLVYDMKITPVNGGNRVDVKMTLTAPGCGMGPVLQSDVQRKLLSLESVTEANVELVWDPPWSMSMLSEAAKLQLGFA